jgi:anti-sigma factor RsiW
MTCRKLIDFLDDYLEGSLAPEVRAAFERHLPACPACRDYLRTYQDSIALARAALCRDQAVPRDVPEDLVRAIKSALEGGARRS